MNKLSGLVLDQYDEDNSTDKLASADVQRLPDDLFALVVMEPGAPALRKFAMATEAVTAESTQSFFRNGHKLPGELQKEAAAGLLRGHAWYGLKPHGTLEKLALGAVTLLNAALTVPEIAKKTSGNLKASKGARGAIMTPQQMKRQSMAARFGA